MNKDQYYKSLSRDPQWTRKNVVLINTDFVQGADLVKSQIRQGDIISSHVSDLIDSLYERGQEIPITVEVVEGDDSAQTVYRPVDGMHRLEALERLREKYPDRSEFSLVRAEIKEFDDKAQRVLYQIECNNHNTLPAKSNNDADAALVIDKVARGVLPGLDKDLQGKSAEKLNRTNPAGYRAALVKFVKATFGWDTKPAEKTVDKFLKQLPGKLKNYTSDSLLKDFSKYAKENASSGLPVEITRRGGKEKVIFTGTQVFKLGSTQHVFPNITGNTFKAKTEDGDTSSVVIIWDNTTIGKDFSDIDATRKQMIQRINEANASALLKRGCKLVDKVFIGPQKLDEANGREPIERGFIEVGKTSRGKFSTDFPKCGWDTTR